jgi:hypothetical protein
LAGKIFFIVLHETNQSIDVIKSGAPVLKKCIHLSAHPGRSNKVTSEKREKKRRRLT